MNISTKVILITAIIYYYFPHSTLAQAPDTIWTKTYGGLYDDRAYSVEITNDDGIVFVGTNYISFLGDYDLWIVKTNSNGDTLWTKRIGDESNQIGYSIKETSDGGLIIVGLTNDNYHILIVRTNSLGETLWTKTYEINLTDVGHSIEETTDGGFVVIGSVSFAGMNSSIWLGKFNSIGDTVWSKVIISSNSENDTGYSIKQCQDKGYILCGRNGLEESAWLIKTDSLGNIIWDKTWNFSGTSTIGYSVLQTSSGDFLMLGNKNGIWLVKTDENGNEYWNKSYDGGNGYSIINTADGNGYLIIGETDGATALILVRIGLDGEILWTKVISDTYLYDPGEYIKQGKDGSFLILGVTPTLGYDKNDARLIKLDSDIVEVENHQENLPNRYYLSQNYPNPFNPSTTINYQIPELSFVTLKVYDVLGNEIVSLVNEEKQAGFYEIEFNLNNSSSGIYFYKLQSGSFVETKKMILLK